MLYRLIIDEIEECNAGVRITSTLDGLIVGISINKETWEELQQEIPEVISAVPQFYGLNVTPSDYMPKHLILCYNRKDEVVKVINLKGKEDGKTFDTKKG